jgi:general secretion pathway protein H
MRLSRGFTILEILVVVAVISLIASTILLNTNFGKPEELLDRHTRDIGKTLRLLLEEAIINDANFALSLVPGGYLVLEFNGEDWVPSEDRFVRSLTREHRYDDELIIDNRIVEIEKKETPDPHILILASGEMTAFEWIISDRDNEISTRMRGDLLGSVTIEATARELP